jgi:hypothetical protein
MLNAKPSAFDRFSVLFLLTLTFAGFSARSNASDGSLSLAPARAAAVDEAVRTLMKNVAHDVTHDGPLAWCKYLETGPTFFMAVNGQMAFANGAAAVEGTQKFALTIKHIELAWGEDLRVDPLTPQLAVVAAPWHEVQIDTAGHRVEEDGFFTALAEYREGRWQFRDAHWSAPMPSLPHN